MANYESPIRQLYDKIMLSFDSSSIAMSSRLLDLLNDGKLDHQTFIDPSHVPLKTPCANPLTRQIELHEPHLSYIWSLTYTIISIVLINDEKARKGQTIVAIHESPEWEELKALFGWALTLDEEYSEWPMNVANPLHQTLQVQQANQLSVDAVRYLMYHEVAHLANGHDTYQDLYRKAKVNGELTREEADTLKLLETEADNYAFDCLFLTTDTTDEQYLKLLGAVIAHLSSFFLLNRPTTNLLTHPDADVRLFNLINKVRLDSELHDTYIIHTVNVGLQFYLRLKGVSFLSDAVYDTFEELASALFKLIDDERIKRNLNSTMRSYI